MIARNHWKCSLAAWLSGASVAAVFASGVLVEVDPATVAWLAPVAAAGGLGPDLDKTRERDHGKVHPGAAAAEAHGPLSRALSEVIAATHGGHRGLTHRYRYALAVCALVALAATWRPEATLAVLLGWWSAWVLWVVLPRHARWASAFLAAGAAFAAWSLAWLPATPWVGAAAGLGWALHIACDRLQSGLFELGGPTERAIAWGSLVGSCALALCLLYPFS